MKPNVILFLTIFCLFILCVFAWMWINFIPSPKMQLYSIYLGILSFGASCYFFKKYYGFWSKAAHKTIGMDGGVKTTIGARVSCIIFGISLPALFFYLITMNSAPLVITLLVGELGTQEFIFKKHVHAYRKCSKPQLSFEGVGELSSRICRLNNNSNSKLKKGDEILVTGLKSGFGIIPKSYEVLD